MQTWRDLLKLHSEPPTASPSSSFLLHWNHFNSWVFLMDLCTHGPTYFHQFKSVLQKPEAVEQMPLIQIPLMAAQAMDMNNSTVSGNIHAIVKLLDQGGVHDPADPSFDDSGSPDLSEYVVLIHGDLGTGEQIQGVQIWQSIEATPWDPFQHDIFIPGLFHLQIACADTIWQCFIHSLAVRGDETSLMHNVLQLWPKEMGTYLKTRFPLNAPANQSCWHCVTAWLLAHTCSKKE